MSDIQTIFRDSSGFFSLTMPEYELPIFGHNMGELRLLVGNPTAETVPFYNITTYLIDHDILACTFRGREDIRLVRRLNNFGFRFVSTYSVVTCENRYFRYITTGSDLSIVIAKPEDYNGMVKIKEKVFDYSTHQLDYLLPIEDTTKRNVARLQSYFDNPNHRAYIIKHENKVVGYLQFVVNMQHQTALCANGAVDPDYQKLFVGTTLYSEAFNDLFNEGVRIITSGYSNQNTPSLKLHQHLGFQIKEHEIHLRLKP